MWTETNRRRVPALRDLLAQRLGYDVLVRHWREGADYAAYTVDTPDGRLVLRVPHREIADTSYDGRVDFADLVRTEATVQRLLNDAGVPCPRLIDVATRNNGQTWSWTLSEHIAHEPVDELDPRLETRLGHIARAIHAIVPSSSELPRRESWEEFIADRTARRVDALGQRAALPPVSDVASLIRDAVRGRARNADRLLHMDLRADNLCIRDAEIVAVLDYSNAVRGDPWLELGRLHAYGTLTDAFIDGYGPAAREALNTPALAAYALDTYAMLALLAVDELDDHDLHERMVAGAVECLIRLAA